MVKQSKFHRRLPLGYALAAPFTQICCPDIHRDCAEQRKLTTSAISSASPRRPYGDAAAIALFTSSFANSVIPGTVGPGSTELTLMPRCPSSFAHTSVKAFMAALEAV